MENVHRLRPGAVSQGHIFESDHGLDTRLWFKAIDWPLAAQLWDSRKDIAIEDDYGAAKSGAHVGGLSGVADETMAAGLRRARAIGARETDT
jgi:hypothetical protein